MKPPSTRATLCAALAFSLALSTVTEATTLISNLGQTLSNSVQLDTTFERNATGFMTGSSPASVTGVTLNLLNQDTAPHTLTASIFTNNAGSPGILVGTFDTPLSVTASDAVFAQHSATSSGISLAANTAYWLVLGLNQNITFNHVNWGVESFVTTDPVTGFTTSSASNLKHSTNSGSTYTNSIAGFGSFELVGAVPEPASASLLMAGVVSFLVTRRRPHLQ
jgi:hypothetical protein